MKEYYSKEQVEELLKQQRGICERFTVPFKGCTDSPNLPAPAMVVEDGMYQNARSYLAQRGIYSLDTIKRMNEVVEWMEGYAKQCYPLPNPPKQ